MNVCKFVDARRRADVPPHDQDSAGMLMKAIGFLPSMMLPTSSATEGAADADGGDRFHWVPILRVSTAAVRGLRGTTFVQVIGHSCRFFITL